MFSTERFGLSIPIANAESAMPGRKISQLMDFLTTARVGQLSQRGRSFSFVHRRFSEYFLIRSLVANPESVPLEDIPSDGRWRDAIVLFSEVAPTKEARRVIVFCIRELRPLLKLTIGPSHPQYRRSLNCLRFLVEAFRSRPHLLKRYYEAIAWFVWTALGRSNDMLISKHAVEATSLLPWAYNREMQAFAITNENPWISGTAFKASRFMPEADAKTLRELGAYLAKLPESLVLVDAYNYAVTLRLSPPLHSLANKYVTLRLQYLAIVAAALLSMTLTPFAFIAILVVGFAVPVLGLVGQFGNSSLFTKFRTGCISIMALTFVFLSLAAFQTLLISIFWILGLSPLNLDHILNSTGFAFLSSNFFVVTGYGKPLSLPWNFGFMLLAAIACFPWAVWLSNLRSDETGLQTNAWQPLFGWISGWKYAFYVTGVIATTPVVYKLIERVLPSLEAIEGTLGHFFSFVLFLILIFAWVVPVLWAVHPIRRLKHAMNTRRDKRLFATLSKELPPTRETIARNFLLFETSNGRELYSQWLNKNYEALQPWMSDNLNRWPNDIRPNVGDDWASILLARLDERWLDLD